MSGKLAATFHGAEPDPQTAQQLAVARAYVARVNECPYLHTHTSLYCSKCGWFADSPIMALVAEVDRLTATPAGGQPSAVHVPGHEWPELDQHYIRATDATTALAVYIDQESGRAIPEHEAGRKVRAKRLSEAEIAAELYRAEWTVLHHRITGHELSERIYGSCRFGTIPEGDLDKVATVRRFAEHPHHDVA
ncbi:hypothetical protein [Arthrobacter sp. SX1312]|uniref:hypothetical protein n=1 Tax=Arthrobacter sp. SX1312 TaxID=2058896 RepID=UPI0011B04163|nr:hypothetical protein [Arthrobacter sp. SX1312]